MQIRKQLATASTKHYPGVNGRRTITIHETANVSLGASAAMHANLQSRGNVRDASWHYQVDDTEVVQSFEHTVQCWHAGDGTGPGNLDSIAIEICVNPDSDFVAAVHNTAELVRQILVDEHLTVADVVQHNHWSGKNCPTFLRAGTHGITWADFIALVTAGASAPTPAPTPAPATTHDDGGIDVSKLPTLKKGDQGLPVKRVQGLLIANGYDVGKAGVDGDWGDKTDAGFAAFQAAHPGTGGADSKPDRVCGQHSWAALLGL